MQFPPSRTAVVVAIFAALVGSCSKSGGPQRAGLPEKTRAIRVAAAEIRSMERTVAATGTLAAQEQGTLSIKVPGRLLTLAVDLGSVVKKGDLIAQVDPQDYDLRVRQAVAALAQARAALGLPLDGGNDTVDVEKTSLVRQAKAVLDEAAKNRERVQSLGKTGLAPQSEVDTAEATYIVALNKVESALDEARTRQAALAQRRAEVDIAEKQLKDTSLRAPFGGAIQARLANLGEFLQTGTPVVTLVRADPLRLRLEVPERDSAGVRAGQTVRVRVEGLTNVVTGTLARISPAITETSRMLISEADIPNEGALRPGLFVRAEIVTNEKESGLAVPAAALLIFAGLEKVVTVREGRALEKTVSTGRRAGDWIELTSGMNAGEIVIIDPGNLRTGQPVSIHEERPVAIPKPETSGP
ncbi:MAG: rane fusion protein multidrug efflux system [Verrucomicrobiota bacterium]